MNDDKDKGMNIIIPLGGIGSRFQTEGYTEPKPFIDVLGKPMIFWVIDNLTLSPHDDLVIVYNPAFMNMDAYMNDVLLKQYPKAQLVELEGPTRGAAETVLLGLNGIIDEVKLSRPCVLCDGDSFYTEDVVSKYRAVSRTHNATVTFVDTQPKPIYSYVTVINDDEGSNDEVLDIKEKIKISDYANSGCYCFKNGKELARYCTKIIDMGITQLSQDMKGEFYTSGVIKAMLDDGIPCKRLEIEKENMYVLGTPAQLNVFLEEWPKKK
eukprot:CAMPEP_0183731708 /NCGR_PEP_ID=MMETSP0737-20130205/36199_1 /TAXON_ID=385413 /ORGANISM="Thalassiosira miniscula, Strain CCMP1093" /LENGTH=266 /DNA_ID=CAMNT_0025964513 /DNA_START=84 /DNA_END=884 /DNA_ORIENTATION=-